MALALPDNPRVHFFESRRSGYVCNRSRTRPRVSANARRDPKADISTLKTFAVESGKPGVMTA
jgi:alkaline phosphatase D